MKALSIALHKLADVLDGTCEEQDWDVTKDAISDLLGHNELDDEIHAMMNEVTDCKAMLALIYRKLEEIEKKTEDDTPDAKVVELKPMTR